MVKDLVLVWYRPDSKCGKLAFRRRHLAESLRILMDSWYTYRVPSYCGIAPLLWNCALTVELRPYCGIAPACGVLALRLNRSFIRVG